MAAALEGEGDRAAALLGMLGPIHRASTKEGAERYAVEPYVVAADIYSAPGKVGRGGWTWYTGSAAWMYRIALEHVLGIQLDGGALRFAPCLPVAFRRYEVRIRSGTSTYHVVVENPLGLSNATCVVTLDGRVVPGGRVPLTSDGETHQVRVELLADR